jgi:hypothetical protein
MFDLLPIKPGLVPELGIGWVQPRGGFVFQSRILLIAKVFVNPRQQFVRFEHPGVGLERRSQFVPGALEVTAIEQDPRAVEMAFGLGHASRECRYRQRDQNTCGRETPKVLKEPSKRTAYEICRQHPGIKDGTPHDWLREAGFCSLASASGSFGALASGAMVIT